MRIDTDYGCLTDRVITRAYNPHRGDWEWCVCNLDRCEIQSPLVFGKTIDEAIENLKRLIGEQDG